MKIWHIPLIVLFLLGSAQGANAQTAINTVKAVYVGHSLINSDMPEIVRTMALSLGKQTRKAVQWAVGAPIIYNWQNCHRATFTGQYSPEAFACDELELGTDLGFYDSLIVTQANNPIILPSNPDDLGSTPEDYTLFLDLFLSKNSSGRAFLYTSWEGQGSPWHQGAEWTTRIAPELRKHELWAARVEQIQLARHGRSMKVTIIPAALALRDLILATEGGRFAGISSRAQLFSDDVHLSALGSYYVACVAYSSLFQQSPAGATGEATGSWGQTIANVDADTARRLQEFAWNVVAGYRGWIAASQPAAVAPRAPAALSIQ